MLESPFKNLAGWRPPTLLKKATIQVFSCEVREIFKSAFFCRIPLITASAPPVAASIFLKIAIAIKQPFCNLAMMHNYFFFSTHRLIYKKSNSFFSKICSQLSDFLNNSVRVYPTKLKISMLDHVSNTFQNTIF